MRKSYKSLEFDVVLEEISKYASFSLGKQKVMNLEPSDKGLTPQCGIK